MPKIVNHDAYRVKLLEQCFDLFTKHSYATISMRQIAKELGVSTGTLYHYFTGKDDLYKQIALILSQEDISQISTFLSQKESIKERLDLFFSLMAADEAEILKSIIFSLDFSRFFSKDERNKYIKEIRKKYLEVLTHNIGLPSDLAALVFAAIDGLSIHHAIAPQAINFERQLILLKKMTLQEMEARNIK